jgi:hypothetical protein
VVGLSAQRPIQVSSARRSSVQGQGFCLPVCYHSTHYSSIGCRSLRHTPIHIHFLAHSPDLRGRMICVNEECARRRRLSELLQWQLLMRGAPHIWDCGPPAPLPPLGAALVGVLSCVRGASVGQMPSGARAAVNTQHNKHRLRSIVVSLVYSIGLAGH